MTRMTGPDCAVMCNLINTHTHTSEIQTVQALADRYAGNFFLLVQLCPRVGFANLPARSILYYELWYINKNAHYLQKKYYVYCCCCILHINRSGLNHTQ